MTAHAFPHTADRSRQRAILLVEDEPFVREATCGILESAGYTVHSAADARAAIGIYESSARPIDLVMTDMVLPGQTGEQLGEELRQRSSEIKVLITSGYGSPEYDSDELSSQTFFLAKPYSRRSLIDKIEKILDSPMQGAASQAG